MNLQLLVYISLWAIRLPPEVAISLHTLKMIVLGEMLDDTFVGEYIYDKLGL